MPTAEQFSQLLPASARRSLRAADLILLLLVAVAAFFILYPIGVVLWQALTSATGDAAAVRQSLSDPSLYWMLFNTVAIVAVSGFLAIVVGAFCAWLNERTDAGGTVVERLLPIIPLVIPTIAAVIGWVTLLSPRAGLINVVAREFLSIFGVQMREGPFNIFSWPGYAFVMFLYLFPFVYILISRAFMSLDPALEEAAAINRAGKYRTFRMVTLPAIKPALSASVLIVIIQGVANFSIAIIVGTGAGIDVLSTRIYRLLYNFPPNIEQAVYMSLIMTFVVQMALLGQRTILRRERFAMIGGKASQATRIALGAWKLPARMIVGLYISLTSVVPFAGLVIVSLQPFWSARIDWANMTLANYHLILFEKAITARAITNSLALGVIGGVIGIAFAGYLLIGVQRRPRWMATLADGLMALPAGLPHSIVGVSFILAFSQGWINLHGTLWLLLIAYLVMFLPQAAGAAASATSSVSKELVEAARLNRASPLRAMLKVQLPLMLPALFSGWVILFVHMAGELTASALLSGVNAPVVGLVLLDQWENGSFPELSAMAVVISFVFSIVVLLVMWLTRGRAFQHSR